jgi:hypothetical protein
VADGRLRQDCVAACVPTASTSHQRAIRHEHR